MLPRLAYLGLTNTFALRRLLPMGNRNKDIEILALRHQIGVLQWQLDDTRVRFSPADRALLAALLHRVPLEKSSRLVSTLEGVRWPWRVVFRCQDELDHRAVDTNLPPRTAQPHSDLEPATSTPCAAGVRAVLQLPPTPSRRHEHPYHYGRFPQPITNHDQIAPARHPPTPPTRRHPQRISPRGLTCTDDIFGPCRTCVESSTMVWRTR